MVRFLFLLALPLAAQNLTVGVKGALRLTSMPAGYGAAESRPYRVGPAIEVGLPLGFAVEADALYSRLGHSMYFHHIGTEEFDRVRANVWEFPVFAKYYAALPLRAAVFGGISPRHASVQSDSTGDFFGRPYASTDRRRAKDHAWIFGAGVEIAARHLRIGPELRVQHTNVPQYPTEWNIANYLPLPRNEVVLFVGLGWSMRR